MDGRMKQSNLVLIGMPSSGKSCVGKAVAQELKMDFIDLDQTIIQKVEMSIAQMFARHGEDWFRDRESEAAIWAASLNGTVISTGGGIIKRAANLCTLRESGKLVFLDRDIDCLVCGAGRPLAPTKEAVFQLYCERYEIYRTVCEKRVENNGTVQDAVRKIKEYWYEVSGD